MNPLSESYRSCSLDSVYKRAEEEKKRKYDQRVREIEHGSFAPLVFSTGGGLAPIAIQVYNRLALMMSEKSDRQYSSVINYIRCKISFSLIRSKIRCLRGYRSIYHSAHRDYADLDIASIVSAGRIC